MFGKYENSELTIDTLSPTAPPGFKTLEVLGVVGRNGQGKYVYVRENDEYIYCNIVFCPDTYSDLRGDEYPKIEDQLDMLWHGMDANPAQRIEPFYSRIKSIKDTHPKQ